MAAAGRGSRFRKAGVFEPKPLVSFRGMPLFWWAAQSAISSGIFEKIHFAVLREHIDSHSIDRVIHRYYPSAQVHVIDSVTSGAAETAAIVAHKVSDNSGIGFVDCDLAFSFESVTPFTALTEGVAKAALCVFPSSSPAYSYVKFDKRGSVVGTVEKKVISNRAIAGLYVWRTAGEFLENYLGYKEYCEYSELFMSGVFNRLIAAGQVVVAVSLACHVSLGTPAEVKGALAPNIKLPNWYRAW